MKCWQGKKVQVNLKNENVRNKTWIENVTLHLRIKKFDQKQAF